MEGKIKAAKKEINCKRDVPAVLYKHVNLNFVSFNVKDLETSGWEKDMQILNTFIVCINKRRKDNKVLLLEVNGKITKETYEMIKTNWWTFLESFRRQGVRHISVSIEF